MPSASMNITDDTDGLWLLGKSRFAIAHPRDSAKQMPFALPRLYERFCLFTVAAFRASTILSRPIDVLLRAIDDDTLI